MISAAVPSFWGSALEDLSSSLSLPFAVTEVGSAATAVADGLQFVAFSLPEQQAAFGSAEELPPIDESLFDFVDVPELEEINECGSPSPMAPLEDLMLEDIPALEEVFDEQAWYGFSTETPVKTAINNNNNFQEESTPKILLNDEPVIEEIVNSTSPVSTYVESCGSDSPMSCYSQVSDELLFPAPEEKRRRVSQISLSSYCSSTGDSTWSPTSASDSDVESRRGGRKSRFSPQDRKERKKAQNRTAAERYRQKRKLQEETIGEEEQQLIDGNNELKTEVTKLQAEVSCLKRLMREMLQAKGIKIPPKNKTQLIRSSS